MASAGAARPRHSLGRPPLQVRAHRTLQARPTARYPVALSTSAALSSPSGASLLFGRALATNFSFRFYSCGQMRGTLGYGRPWGPFGRAQTFSSKQALIPLTLPPSRLHLARLRRPASTTPCTHTSGISAKHLAQTRSLSFIGSTRRLPSTPLIRI